MKRPGRMISPKIELSITFVMLLYQVYTRVIVGRVLYHIVAAYTVILGECSHRYKAARSLAFHSETHSHFVLSFSPTLSLSVSLTYHSFFPGVLVKGLSVPSCLLVGLMRLTDVDSLRFRAMDVGLSCFA